jgi:hypothetical protein
MDTLKIDYPPLQKAATFDFFELMNQLQATGSGMRSII